MKGAGKVLWRSVTLPLSLARALPVASALAAAAALFAFNLTRGDDPLRTAAGLAGLAWYCMLAALPRPGTARRVEFLSDGEAPAASIALLVSYAFFDAGQAASIAVAFAAVFCYGAFADAVASPRGNERTAMGVAAMIISLAAGAVLYPLSGPCGPPHDAVGKAFLGGGWRLSTLIPALAPALPACAAIVLFRRELMLRSHGRDYYASSLLSYHASGVLARLLRAAASTGVLALSGWLCGAFLPFTAGGGVREASSAALRLAIMLFLLHWLDFRIVVLIAAALSIAAAVAQSRTGRIADDRTE